MRCLYEVLGVDQEVDDSAIKKAYRKLALIYHPDKNQDNPTAAEERFKEVQNAYEILSDKHERAWYDSHRDSILRSGQRHQAGGDAGDVGMGERPDDFVDVYEYFTSTCYSGFGDGPRGFYGVYSQLFETLGAQEAAAAASRADRRGAPAPPRMPPFGLSSASWGEVSSFYAEWSNFGTAKDFSWADQYNPASAPNRKVRRAMEQENEKARKAAKKEYNDGVRSLVDFLRKRDKRVAAHQVEEAKRQEEREAAAAARREEERQARLARAAAYQDAAWAAAAEDGQSSGSDDGLEGETLMVWHCPACDKHFKSEASMSNHENSKKHKEQVELLRMELLLMEEEGVVEDSIEEEEESSSSSRESEEVEEKVDVESEEDGVETSEEKEGEESSSSSTTTGESEEEDDGTAESEERISSEGEEENSSEDEDAMLARLISSRAAVDDEEDEDEEEEGEEVGTAANSEGSSDDSDDWGGAAKTKGPPGKQRKKMGRRRGKDVEKPQKPPAPPPAAAKSKKKGDQSAGVALACTSCGAEFASRNQLFKHIAQTGHAAAK